MPDTTVHPSLAAIDTLELLVSETIAPTAENNDHRELYDNPESDTDCDSMNIVANCEAIIAIHKQWIESFDCDYAAMITARTNALKRLLTDLFYTEAAKHITP